MSPNWRQRGFKCSILASGLPLFETWATRRVISPISPCYLVWPASHQMPSLQHLKLSFWWHSISLPAMPLIMMDLQQSTFLSSKWTSWYEFYHFCRLLTSRAKGCESSLGWMPLPSLKFDKQFYEHSQCLFLFQMPCARRGTILQWQSYGTWVYRYIFKYRITFNLCLLMLCFFFFFFFVYCWALECVRTHLAQVRSLVGHVVWGRYWKIKGLIVAIFPGIRIYLNSRMVQPNHVRHI